MNSQLVANINLDLKNKAMEMAKKDWLTMKALLSFLLKAYVEKEIKIKASISSHKREYGNFEIEDLNDDELNIINSSKILKNASQELSLLLKQKWIS